MPSQHLVCPEVAISRRIHLREGKSTSNRPCESFNASPYRCGQEPWILVALWGRADVVTAGTFLGHVCPAVGCPGRNSRRPGLGWCRCSNGERRNWLFPSCTTVQGYWMLPRSPGSHSRGCCVVTPVDMLAIEVANVQTGVWERRDGRWSESRAWRFVDVDDLITCDVYAQPLSLWLIWRLIDQWPFQPLVDKRGKAVIHLTHTIAKELLCPRFGAFQVGSHLKMQHSQMHLLGGWWYKSDCKALSVYQRFLHVANAHNLDNIPFYFAINEVIAFKLSALCKLRSTTSGYLDPTSRFLNLPSQKRTAYVKLNIFNDGCCQQPPIFSLGRSGWQCFKI